jgi:hypothetical protein
MQLELIRKLQLLETCWSPWFEGLAVFGESAVDPRDDTHATVPSLSVVYNLSDEHLAGRAKAAGRSIEQEYAAFLAAAEERFAEARDARAFTRLTAYLGNYATKYRAGYLAVRAVVSAWRRTLGRSLSGAEAFALLLHISRFHLPAPIPDLGQSADRFQEAVIEMHVEWVASITRLSAADLEQFLQHGWRRDQHGSMAISEILGRETPQGRISAS